MSAMNERTETIVDAARVPKDFLARIPRDFAREHLVVLQEDSARGAVLVAAPATHPAILHNVQVALARQATLATGDPSAIAAALDAAYGAAVDVDAVRPSDPESAAPELEALIAQADKDLLSASGKGPVVRLVDVLLFDAVRRRASDVHLQPTEDRLLVRYRVDGMLVLVRDLPRRLAAGVTSRIKVMGRMDIAECRVPQDGRDTVRIGTHAIDLRIATLPTTHGERVVIRLLDANRELATFDELCMPDDVAKRFLERARRANGMVLLTGPTGSGKTTTLYATLRAIGSPEKNLMTIEDPVEYELSSAGLSISQAQVNETKGVTFASGLRHLLRQDPDVVMVGEIRDAETAKISIQSSLTGHLVLSTLHTNDAPGAVTRLIDLGVAPYLVAASLSAVCAQRLVRRRHAACKGEGCPDCGNTGYAGRVAIFELLCVDDALRAAIAAGEPLQTLRKIARQAGMPTLREEGLALVERGVTTRAEVERVVEVES
jgi:type II secretory ATPase GspE/PulE/Tfp pilus assembly ATPase PilB-like protein